MNAARDQRRLRGRRDAVRRRRPRCSTSASRPRSPSGTMSCCTVLRNTAEMTSAPPAIARKTSASPRLPPTSPNAAIAAPHTDDRDRGSRVRGGGPDRPSPSVSAPTSAPNAGAREQPTEHRGAVVEPLDGEHREQHAGHPEHHRDDVDGERRLQDPLALHVAQSVHHGREPDVLLDGPRPARDAASAA